MDLAGRYSGLKGRASSLEAQASFWKGRLAEIQERRAKLLAEVNAAGVRATTLEEAKKLLEEKVVAQLASLEADLVKAEEKFKSLRSIEDGAVET